MGCQGLYLMRSETPKEALIKLRLGPHNKKIIFLVDTRASRTTIRKLPQGCKLIREYISVIGVGGELFQVPVIKKVQIESDEKFGVNDLLLLP